jgi:hypothetical protein
MARAAGISPASVQRLWAASDIKPHLSRTFKLSNDKHFEEKFWDVIGLYLNPPEKALVPSSHRVTLFQRRHTRVAGRGEGALANRSNDEASSGARSDPTAYRRAAGDLAPGSEPLGRALCAAAAGRVARSRRARAQAVAAADGGATGVQCPLTRSASRVRPSRGAKASCARVASLKRRYKIW